MNDMPRNERARGLWAHTKFHLWPGRYRLVSIPPRLLAEAARLLAGHPEHFGAVVFEKGEVSLTIAERLWKRSGLRERARAEAGPFKVITFDLALDLDVVGYLAPATARLAEAAVAVVPQCAYHKDHILVPADRVQAATKALENLIRDCRRTVRTTGSRATRGPRRRRARA